MTVRTQCSPICAYRRSGSCWPRRLQHDTRPPSSLRIGVPRPGDWREILNTDSSFYGGSNVGNGGTVGTNPVPAHGQAQSLELVLPPLATILLAPG